MIELYDDPQTHTVEIHVQPGICQEDKCSGNEIEEYEEVIEGFLHE